MKKVLRYVKIFIVFLLFYFLQSNLFTWFNIAGVQPNLFIILVLLIGLYTGKLSGLICGTLIGILIDLFVQINVIIEPLMLGTLGFVSGLLAKNFSTESRMNIMVMTVASTAIYEIFCYILKIFIYSTPVEFWGFIRIILIEMLYNAMIVIIIYPIIQRINQKIDDDKFKNKILLRYY